MSAWTVSGKEQYPCKAYGGWTFPVTESAELKIYTCDKICDNFFKSVKKNFKKF